MNSPSTFEFGPFRLDLDAKVLFRGQNVVPLSPKAVETLLVLVERRGSVVDKNELIRLVWPDTFIEEGGLARNISVLRKALGDEFGEGGFIETVPKRGYRFIPTVPEVAAEKPARHASPWVKVAVGAAAVFLAAAAFWWRSAAPNHGPIATLAVLDFRNASGDVTQDYFAATVSEALIADLAKIRELMVFSAESGAPSQAGAVLRGTAKLSGTRVSVTAELLDAKTARVLWAHAAYAGDLKDILSLENEIASDIAREIQINLSAEEKRELAKTRVVDPGAIQSYRRGRYYWERRTDADLKSAISEFQDSINQDATYAMAYVGLADAYSLLGSIGTDGMEPRQAFPRAKEAAMNALRLDDNLAEAHASLAYILLSFDWDLPAAQKEFEKAIKLNAKYATAHHWYGHYYLAAGDMKAAMKETLRASELAPNSLIITVGIGWCSYYSGDFKGAREEYKKALALGPDFPLGHLAMGLAYQQEENQAQAIPELESAVTSSGDSPVTVAALGRAYAMGGQSAKAEVQLNRLKELRRSRYVPALYMTWIQFARGEREDALVWLKKAVEERSDYLVYALHDPDMREWRTYPSFQRELDTALGQPAPH